MSFIAKVAAVRAAMGLPADMPLPTVIDIELETYGGDDVGSWVLLEETAE